jgi:hypothetical protein
MNGDEGKMMGMGWLKNISLGIIAFWENNKVEAI